ncbi:lactococcin 972 family bacteriocin [Streptomyces sp. NPDC048330]|uniref:lactococcin 972 family bacteriocin n=1 Tax=Streptomyces sp. NPDC048330 TaxID=3365533 RepID=UPI00371F96C6
MVTLVIDDSAGSITPMTVIEVGGGTWAYGWEARNDRKYCYSNYYHHDVNHGSTVRMAGSEVKGVAFAGQTSYANLTAGFAYTCSTYYAKY